MTVPISAVQPTPLNRIIGLIRLVRLSNSLPASLLVVVGAILTSGWPVPWSVWKAAIVMWHITAFGYVSNDCFDIAEDSVNKPDRPIPKGWVSLTGARWFAIALAGSVLLISTTLDTLAILAASLVLCLLTLYNFSLKGMFGVGNLLIALLAGCTLIVGGTVSTQLSLNTLQPVLIPAAILTTFIMTRELLKTVEDRVGDGIAGKQTLVVFWGVDKIRYPIVIFAFVTIGLTLYAFWLLHYSLAYLILINLGVNAPLLAMSFHLWYTEPSHFDATYHLALLKGSYFAGILALLLA